MSARRCLLFTLFLLAGGARAQEADPLLLRDLEARQRALALLEMDVKKAELEKRLRDLQTPELPPLAASLPAAPVVTEPAVRRIYKRDGRLAAVIATTGGERMVTAGSPLSGGLTVVAIDAEGVWVRHGGQPPFRLSERP